MAPLSLVSELSELSEPELLPLELALWEPEPPVACATSELRVGLRKKCSAQFGVRAGEPSTYFPITYDETASLLPSRELIAEAAPA